MHKCFTVMCVCATGMVPLLWKWYRTNGGSVRICCSVLCVLSGVIHWCCSCCWHASVFPGKIYHVVYAFFGKEVRYCSFLLDRAMDWISKCCLCKYNSSLFLPKLLIVWIMNMGPTNAFGFMNVILLHSNHQHVWATHVSIFRVVGTRWPHEWLEHLGYYYIEKLGHTVAQLVEALRYKSEGRRFDSRWFHWIF